MPHSRSSPSSAIALPPGVAPTPEGVRWRLAGIARNIAALFHNNRAESAVAIAWVGWGIACLFFHGIARDDARGVGVRCFAVAALCGDRWTTAPPSRDTKGEMWVGVISAWSGAAVAFGLSVYLAFAWLAIGFAAYWPLLKMVTTVKHTPATQLVLPPKESTPPPADPYERVTWLDREDGPRRPLDNGYTQRFRLPVSSNARSIAAGKVDEMASILQVDPEAVELRAVKGNGGVLDVNVYERDSLATPKVWPWASAETFDAWAPIPFGVYRDGTVAHVSHVETHTLVGGMSGSGKSFGMRSLLLPVALDPAADLICLNPKVTDLLPFRDLAWRYAEESHNEALAILEELLADMERRNKLIAHHRASKVHEIPLDRHTGHPIMTKVVLAIDELAHYTETGGNQKSRDEITRLLTSLAKMSRAAGISIVAATQYPKDDVVPTGMRGQFGQRIAFRMSHSRESAVILGNGSADSSRIDKEDRGKAYLDLAGETRLIRTFLIETSEMYDMLEQVPPPPITRPMILTDAVPARALESGGVARFPDGQAVPDGWVRQVWDAFGDDDWHTVGEFVKADLATANPIRDKCRAWAARGWLTPSKIGNTVHWRKP